jgi:hypothetical protein
MQKYRLKLVSRAALPKRRSLAAPHLAEPKVFARFAIAHGRNFPAVRTFSEAAPPRDRASASNVRRNSHATTMTSSNYATCVRRCGYDDPVALFALISTGSPTSRDASLKEESVCEP